MNTNATPRYRLKRREYEPGCFTYDIIDSQGPGLWRDKDGEAVHAPAVSQRLGELIVQGLNGMPATEGWEARVDVPAVLA